MSGLFVLVAWLLVLVAIAAGWGALTLRVTAIDREAPAGFFVHAFTGIFTMTVLAVALHFVVPLAMPVTTAIAAGGLAGLLSGWRRLVASLRPWGGWWLLVVLPLAFGYVAGGTSRGSEYDTGLYHLQSITWLHEQALPFGLVNVHGRLAYNPSWLSFASVLWLPVLDLRGPFLANMLQSVVLLGTFAEQVRAAPRPVATFSALAFALPLLPPGGFFAWQAGAPATDVPAILATWFAFSCALEVAASTGPARVRAFALLAMSSLLAVTTKFLVAPVLLLAFLPVLADRSLRDDLRQAPLRRWFAFLGVFAVLHVARSGVLSGCLAYPVAVTCAPFLPWSASREAAEAEALSNRNWARLPGAPAELLADGEWLPAWLELRGGEPELQAAAVLAVAGVLCVLLASAWRGLGQAAAALSVFARPLAVGVVGIATWFVAAPDPRFGLGFLLGVPLLLWSLSCELLPRPRASRTIALGLVAASLVAIVVHGIHASREVRRTGVVAWPDIPRASVRRDATRTGLVVWRVVGDDDRCWDAPLPCTPLFDADLVQEAWFGRAVFRRRPAPSADE